jgi:hypothetical protein
LYEIKSSWPVKINGTVMDVAVAVNVDGEKLSDKRDLLLSLDKFIVEVSKEASALVDEIAVIRAVIQTEVEVARIFRRLQETPANVLF